MSTLLMVDLEMLVFVDLIGRLIRVLKLVPLAFMLIYLTLAHQAAVAVTMASPSVALVLYGI